MISSEAVKRGVFHVEHGDAEPIPFSFVATSAPTNKAPCYLMHTNERVHELVRSHINESPLYNGQIAGIGPRYCPSLEDKVMRFPDRERHQLFLEPEGLDVEEIYVNGFSMSLPAETQRELIHSLPGLESAEMLRPGYAVEYDFVQPTELRSTLETHRLPGLFFAGQINGTSGYEEAAGQGIVAGLNAALSVQGRQPMVFGRDEAYLGIMVDDLVTKGCLEPYRMFTSRAEYRLLLRTDNADLRLTPKGRDAGLVDDARWERFQARKQRFETNIDRLQRSWVKVEGGARIPASQALRRPEVTLAKLEADGDVVDRDDGGGSGARPVVGRDVDQVRGLPVAADPSRGARPAQPSAARSPTRFRSNASPVCLARWSSDSQKPVPKPSVRPNAFPASRPQQLPSSALTSTGSDTGNVDLKSTDWRLSGNRNRRWSIRFTHRQLTIARQSSFSHHSQIAHCG